MGQGIIDRACEMMDAAIAEITELRRANAHLRHVLDYVVGASKGQHADPDATLRDIAAQATAALLAEQR